MMHFFKLLTIYKRIKEIVFQIGYINTAILLFHRILIKLFSGKLRIYKYYLTAQPVTNRTFLPPNRGKKITVKQISRDDPIVSAFPRPDSIIKNRFDTGAVCLVALKENVFVGYIWFMLGAYQEDEVRAKFVPLPASATVWDFDIYVHPDYRLGHTFLRLWDEANRFLLDRKIEWSCSRISVFNAPSINVHTKLGALNLGQVIFFCIGSCQLTLATLFPYIHVSTHLNSYPTFFIDTQKNNTIFPMKGKESTTE